MQQQKSRAFYRIQATRMMIGAGNILKKHAADQARKVRHTWSPLVTVRPVVHSPPKNTAHLTLTCFFQVVSSHETQAQEDDPHTIRMEFEPSLYQCFENCGSLKLTVARHGGDPGVTVKVCVCLRLCVQSRRIACLLKVCVCVCEGKKPKDTQADESRDLLRDQAKIYSELLSLTSFGSFS